MCYNFIIVSVGEAPNNSYRKFMHSIDLLI